jgi:integrase
MFKRICTEAGAGDSWTPRELRTTFVSLLSHQGVSIEEIARLAGHATTRTTEIVYRHELRPVITTGGDLSLNHEGNAAARRGLERLDT